MIKCPNCGAELKFDASSEKVTCEYCKSSFNPEELKVKVSHADKVETYEGKAYSCSQCSATLMTFDETAITFCSYCGSQAMIEEKMMRLNNPDYIIPFSKTKEECINAYKRKISKSLFAPSYMKSDIVVSKFRGIYIPYCVYHITFDGKTTNSGSKYTHRRGDYEYYDDYTITSDVSADYDGISYDLISNFDDIFSQSIPHDFKGIKKFNPNYLSGFYADTVDVDDNTYEKTALKVASNDASIRMRHVRDFKKYGCSNPKVDLQVTDKKNAMYPVYFLAIRNKKNDAINYAIVNGQTAEVVIDIPIDFKKYILISFIMSIIVFLLIEMFLVLTPKEVCIFSVVVSSISLFTSIGQLKKIKNRETHANDLGYNSKNKIKNDKTISKFKYIYKPLIGIIIGVAVLLLNFVSDIYYYASVIIVLILVVLSFYDLVIEHNLLVSTKLPQLEKRGGDENE